MKDYENNLRAVRQVIERGNASRLCSILSIDSRYESVASVHSFDGPDSIINRFDTIYQKAKGKVKTHLASITASYGNDVFPIRSRCIVLSYDSEDQYESILFLK